MPSTEELLEAYSTIRRRLSVEANALLRNSELGTRQFIILKALSDSGEVNVTDLADRCMTDPGTVSRSIAQLEKSGLVGKFQSKVDGRVWTAKLTKKGLDIIPEVNRVYSELSQRCFGHLKSDQKTALFSLLLSVAERLGKQREESLHPKS